MADGEFKEWKANSPCDNRIWEFTRGYTVREAGKHENQAQFRAFQFYLNSGGQRTLAATAEFMDMGAGTISKWADTYNWDKRCVAWDKKQMALALKDHNRMERNRHRRAIQEFRESNELQAKQMMEVSNDLMSIIQKRIIKAEAEGEDIPMHLVSGLMRAAANISDSGRQAWATSLGVTELMQVVDQELEEVQVEVMDPEHDEAFDIPVEE